MFRVPLRDKAQVGLLESRHAEHLFACIEKNRYYLRPWLTWVDETAGVDDVKRFIAEASEQFARNAGFHIGIFVEDSPVGGVGVHDIDWKNRKTSMGYWIAENHQGKGLATLACSAVISHAFSVWKLNRLEIRSALNNERSRALAKRLGFFEEGVRREYEYIHGQYRDLVAYSLLAAEWSGRGSALGAERIVYSQ